MEGADDMGKKHLSEEDIKARYITPAIIDAGWDINKQVRLEYAFTAGRIILRGNVTARGKKKRADYVLFYKNNFPLAVIEAKDNNHPVGAGLQQGIEYAKALDISYVYASNGDAFVEQNLITGEVRELRLEEFPSPEELYQRYLIDKNINEAEEKVILEPYYYVPNYKTPRYYQRVAINRTVDAVAKGQERVLLVSATGTGKTFMTFQIIYRLWKSGLKKRILFLADRNVLVDQTISGDFKPFSGKMTKVKNKDLDSSYEIYLALYQQLTGDDGEETFRQFQPNFFDLIVIDECHRGSAKEESAWRKVLDYFSSATHIGCTATPIETKEASSHTYFGEPIYEYSLKQGINDGFLAPYKVIRIGLDRDLEGYRPEAGKVDKYGYEIEDREYNIKDFERSLVIDDRTRVIASKITEFLKKTDRFSKTIVFCVDIEHAERMRQALINENKDLYAENDKYIMRITGDNDEGKEQLDYFIDEESDYPVIAVTSKLMTTGVDAKMCKLIVLENNINSMTEFKQIIGRGTRLLEEYGKTYFTIMDFRNSSRLFADPAFDGRPEVVIDIDGNDPVDEPEPPTDEEEDGSEENDGDNRVKEDNGEYGTGDTPPFNDDGEDKPRKYYIGDVTVRVLSERVQYVDKDGKLITESLIDYTKKNILEQYARLDDFLRTWTEAEKKQAIIDELQDSGVLLDAVREELGKTELDDFDLICHLAYDKPPLTKKERAENVKKRHYLYKYSDTAQQVIEALLDKYANDGIKEIEDTKVLQLKEFAKIGSPMKIVKAFGGKEAYLKAVKELENEIYYA
ncbi:DEAD/DEAH box helicase family protein [Bacillus paralicheniformis]|mgnify:CR=1 FL=1|uniref:EcoAI/FtnUII family type I restriction enzme subunit R n=2 Tax=Bacillaceae TaxID=186817 RepID=UPI001B122D55|nr:MULTISPECIES: DEAD/DEAH box helicase family protein [Bacillus]MDE1361554.1 DEAD/DEAH box helicase family protein [Bacillus paralicheniformis]MEC2097231.1 DEAD/DEAH box helicase family protein [Bacillus paralicheniformis]MEC2117233.1 DEAD/DEAH box helicase family protein [Bacillus paralicheniformis]MEC2170452.1 DEAD/DEAH box helicase family protein [Bacillus paralicheniformis]MEC2320953.1 DEAD/DEAH box helicase family protein [Bacillus paralicheniformis]